MEVLKFPVKDVSLLFHSENNQRKTTAQLNQRSLEIEIEIEGETCKTASRDHGHDFC